MTRTSARSPGRRLVNACHRVREESATLAFLACHPREIRRLPQWRPQRNAATMALRSPWWPYDAVAWVAASLPERPRVFEYGGGGSTLWLEDHGATVTAVEHDEAWHRQLAGQVTPGVTLLYRPPAAAGAVTSAIAGGYFDAYAAAVDGEPDGSLDLVIIDGRARVECARRAMPKVKPGGLLLLDDADRARYRRPPGCWPGGSGGTSPA